MSIFRSMFRPRRDPEASLLAELVITTLVVGGLLLILGRGFVVETLENLRKNKDLTK